VFCLGSGTLRDFRTKRDASTSVFLVLLNNLGPVGSWNKITISTIDIISASKVYFYRESTLFQFFVVKNVI
jgi:hypothetical protein